MRIDDRALAATLAGLALAASACRSDAEPPAAAPRHAERADARALHDAGEPPAARHEIVVDDEGVETTIHEVERTPTPELIPVAEVARMLREDEAVLCDVNALEARAHFGVLPGALELSHPSRFDLGELPADRDTPLVFYCATPSCGASLQSGTRAILAGYSRVYALRGGMVAWLEAGRETVTPRSL
jgi:rhodanese-related sulfurtransferase